jgi:hypothetical protein
MLATSARLRGNLQKRIAMVMTKGSKLEAAQPSRAAAHANSFPADGFSLLVDDKFKTHFGSQEEAEAAATALKTRFPFLRIAVRAAISGERRLIELPTP